MGGPRNEAMGSEYVVRGKNESDERFQWRKEIQYHYGAGLQIRETVSKLCPEFFVSLEKSEATGSIRTPDEQIKIVSENMAKWVGRWIVMAKWVVDDKGVEKWIVDKEEWKRKQRSGIGSWVDVDKEWEALQETGKKNWWKNDEAKFWALGIPNKAYVRIFWSTKNPVGSCYGYAVVCGFVVGKNINIEQFTQDLVKKYLDKP